MKTLNLATTALLLLPLLAACGGGRTPEAYQTDVTKLIATRNDQVQTCYRDALKENPSVAGILTLRYWINYSGEFHTYGARQNDLGVVKNKTTVPESLSDCVMKAINDLKLTPADKSAQVTWTWKFAPDQAPIVTQNTPAPASSAAPTAPSAAPAAPHP